MKNKLVLSAGSIFALLLWSNSGFAACKLNSSSFIAQNVIMDIGAVTINPDAAVGTILKTGSFPITGKPNSASCDRFGGTGIGKILIGSPVQTSLGNVYSTNIQGIGVRLYRDSGDIQTYYPHVLNLSSNSTLSLAAGMFKVDIVKTGAITGTGALSSGLYSTYYLDGDGESKPSLTSTLNANGIVITNPTCIYRDGTDGQTVELERVGAQEFSGVGSVAKAKDFWIKLACNGGNQSDQKLNLTFTYNPDPLRGGQGVIRNTTGAGYATGVGVQVLKDDDASTVTNGRKINVATVTRNQSSNPEIKLRAQYYQTAAQVTAGRVAATATVTISYE